MRSGDEPVHARSLLRQRLLLVLLALVLVVTGVLAALARGSTGWAVAFAAVGVAVLVDGVLVLRRIRAGAHYQPGPDVPPYQPIGPDHPAGPRPRRPATSMETRRRRYLVLMAICLGLLLVAWVAVRPFSSTAAVVLTVLAMLIPPVAAVVANLGSPIMRPPPPSDPDR